MNHMHSGIVSKSSSTWGCGEGEGGRQSRSPPYIYVQGQKLGLWAWGSGLGCKVLGARFACGYRPSLLSVVQAAGEEDDRDAQEKERSHQCIDGAVQRLDQDARACSTQAGR